jgi:hypothetical protein
VTEIFLKDTQCGLIFEDDDVIRGNMPGGGKRELVMIASSTLSGRSSVGDYAEFIMPIYGHPRSKREGVLFEMFDARKLPHKAGLRCIVHFLLVQWNGDLANRVAVGLVHRDAWRKVRTRRKLVKVV